MGHRKRNIAAAVAACLALCVSVGVLLWHPWDAGIGAAEVEAQTPVEQSEASSDDGQGYVGANGEGAIKRDDYGSDAEYGAAMAGATKERDWNWADYPFVDGPNGVRYRKGFLCVDFYRSYGEQHCHDVISSLGGTWLDDTFAWNTGMEWASTYISFPDDIDVYAMADILSQYPEVEYAGPFEDSQIWLDGD